MTYSKAELIHATIILYGSLFNIINKLIYPHFFFFFFFSASYFEDDFCVTWAGASGTTSAFSAFTINGDAGSSFLVGFSADASASGSPLS